MKSTRNKQLLCAGILSLLGHHAYAAPSYRLIDLGNMGSNEVYARDINNNGDVVGNVSTSMYGSRAFLYRNGVMKDISSPVQLSTESHIIATHISDSGVVTLQGGGTNHTSAPPENYIYYANSNTYQKLDSFIPSTTNANGVAVSIKTVFRPQTVLADGRIAGNASIAETTLQHGVKSFKEGPAIYNNGQITFLTQTNGKSTDNGYVYGSNRRGELVGNFAVAQNTSLDGVYNYTRAFFSTGISGSGFQDLGMFSTGIEQYSVAYAINDAGVIVGSSRGAQGNNKLIHAFRATKVNGTYAMQDLGSLLATNGQSFAYDINTYNEIVGKSSGNDGTYQVGFLHKDGTLHNLNNLLDSSGTGWVVSDASAINDQGQILAHASNPQSMRRVVLLNPVTTCAAPNQQLAGLFRFNEATGTLVTNSASSVHGTTYGAPIFSAGAVKNALTFNGTQRVEVPHHDAVTPVKGDFTFEAWVKTGESLGVLPILSKKASGTSNSNNGYHFAIQDGKLMLWVGNETKSSDTWLDTRTINDNQWHHVAVTVDRDNPKGVVFYVDGSPGANFDPTRHMQYSIYTANSLIIGGELMNGFFFRGSLDEVSIYNKALSATEIKAIFDARRAGKCAVRQRTVILMYGPTIVGQDMYLRGGIDWTYAKSIGRDCNVNKWLCAIPITHNLFADNAERKYDKYLDWHGEETGQGGSAGSPLVWTTNNINSSATVAKNGYGYTPLNKYGDHYWMLDVNMDCSQTVNSWFELKSFIRNGSGWEQSISDANAKWSSGNHFAQCGKLNVFKRDVSAPVAITNL
jgi:probable HAF family extracellular repeat protein